jgi:GTP-binding protein
MRKAIVAIIGRPNVGKSTLFNKIAGRRISIVEDTPGVTRDRIYADTEWRGIPFILIDTGGLDPDSGDIILAKIRQQAEIAMDISDVIIFLVDGRDGLTATDKEVSDILMKTGKKVLLVVNKVDASALPVGYYDFYELGLGEPIPVSAANMLGLGDLLDHVVDSFPHESRAEKDDDVTRIAVIGKPNVGKSSLINSLLGEERVIVSDIAGTTRDAIDTPFLWNNEEFIIIDTAGIRRKSRIYEDIERYSVIRALGAIERSDVCLVMLDAVSGISEQDKRIAGIAHEEGKGVIITVNKWDLIDKDTRTMYRFSDDIKAEFPFMSYAPILFISAKTGQRLAKVMETVKYVSETRSMRVTTGQLNGLIADAMMMKPPPSDKGKQLKIYYASQVGIKPPLFSFKINSRNLMHFSYSRYLENRIREGFGFEGTSIKFVFREKGERDE